MFEFRILFIPSLLIPVAIIPNNRLALTTMAQAKPSMTTTTTSASTGQTHPIATKKAQASPNNNDVGTTDDNEKGKQGLKDGWQPGDDAVCSILFFNLF